MVRKRLPTPRRGGDWKDAYKESKKVKGKGANVNQIHVAFFFCLIAHLSLSLLLPFAFLPLPYGTSIVDVFWLAASANCQFALQKSEDNHRC